MSGDLPINGTSNGGDNTLNGNAAHNLLSGAGGNDLVVLLPAS